MIITNELSNNENTSELMTPIEKANELYSKYDDLLNKDFGNPIVFDNQLKQCALIAVDEILEMDLPILEEDADEFYDYWEQVKKEINKL
jgi:hypothetical protein